MITDPIGIYLHIPFCVRKCNYCDFCSYPAAGFSRRSEYIDRLCDEIASYRGRKLRADTVFFGGGTPSLLNGDEIRRICESIRQSFDICSDAEFTIEANPKTLTAEGLRAFMDSGVNRLSIGLQSIHENELKKLGRIHSFDDFVSTYNLAKDMGVANINIDLMYGIPGQTSESFVSTLETAAALMPEHLSVYGLIIEEGTDFYNRRGELDLPTEDQECNMYYDACRILREHGYVHYEISNYSLPGHECRHNLKYWHGKEYVGFGVSAHSYFDNVRFSNSDDVDLYMNSQNMSFTSLSDEDKRSEYIMLNLRLAKGISLSDYRSRFALDFIRENREFINLLHSKGLIRIENDTLALTEQGFYVSNSILAELI